MVSGISAAGQQFLSNLTNVQNSLNQAQNQLSSGLKVANASDAPDQVSAILQLHANIQRNQQIQTNLNLVQGEVNTSDQALSSGISLLDQVHTLAAQGLGADQSAATRTTLANQVEGLLEQLVSISQTSVDGRYVFSGDADQSPSYQLDLTSPTGVDRLQISASTRQIEDSSGATFAVGLSANQIFDARDSGDNPTSSNVFAAVNAVRVALESNDTSGLQTATSSISDASAYLNQQLEFYGNAENRITAALSNASQANVSLQTELSNRQDADETSAILALQQDTVDLQASLASEAKLPTQSLFDLLS